MLLRMLAVWMAGGLLIAASPPAQAAWTSGRHDRLLWCRYQGQLYVQGSIIQVGGTEQVCQSDAQWHRHTTPATGGPVVPPNTEHRVAPSAPR